MHPGHDDRTVRTDEVNVEKSTASTFGNCQNSEKRKAEIWQFMLTSAHFIASGTPPTGGSRVQMNVSG